jgi:hypothetical protein
MMDLGELEEELVVVVVAKRSVKVAVTFPETYRLTMTMAAPVVLP